MTQEDLQRDVVFGKVAELIALMQRPTTPAKVRERFMAKVRKDDLGCWLWTRAFGRAGYGHFGVHNSVLYSHRVSYELHVGPIPVGMFVCHKCDTPACVNPAHLWLGTNADNVRDMFAKGRGLRHSGDTHWAKRRPDLILRGEDNRNAKLTEEDVSELRRLAAAGIPRRDLQARFGISRGHVRRIALGLNWGAEVPQ